MTKDFPRITMVSTKHLNKLTDCTTKAQRIKITSSHVQFASVESDNPPSRLYAWQNLNVKENEFDKVSEHDSWQSVQKGRIVRLRGIVTTGVKEAVFFTGLPWVKKQFVDKLGIEAYPGTFNIELLASEQNKLAMVGEAGGVEITPPDADFCAGKGFPALIGGRIIGAIVIPLVPNYPRLKLEIISSQNIRQALSLKDGDMVEVEVCLW